MKKLVLLIYIFGITVSGFAQDYSEINNQGRIENFQGLVGVYNEQMKNKRTASGEVYNPELFTAAHQDLPFGTQLRVTNFANGRSVIVTVNDRGSKNKGRVLDLSKKAAEALDFLREGVAYVKVDVLADKKAQRKTQPTIEAQTNDDEMSATINNEQNPDKYYKDNIKERNSLVEDEPDEDEDVEEETVVQDQIFDTKKGVEKNTKAVNKLNPDEAQVIAAPSSQKMSVNRIFVIQFGAFSTQAKAEAFQEQLSRKGIKTYYAKEGKQGAELYKVRESTIFRDLQEVFSKVLEYKQQGIDCFAVGKFFIDDKKK